MIYRPENVLLLGAATYLLLYLLSPLEVLVPIELGSFAFIALTSSALVVGSWSADRFRVGGRSRQISFSRLKRMESRLFWTTLVLGLTGHLLRLADRYVIRGVGSLTGVDAREVLISEGANQLSLIGGILYPFGYLPIFVILGARALPRTSWKVALAAIIFLIPALDALVLFSRSFLLVSFAMSYFGLSLTLFRGRALPRQLVLPALLGAGTVVTISVLVFAWRLEQMSFDILDSTFLSAYSHTVVPNATADSVISSGSTLGGLTASLLPVAQYYVHGILELQVLWSVSDTQAFSGGALLFAPYLKALSILGLASAPDLFDLFPREGVFTSFWGPLWVDFGWFSPIVMFLFGFMGRMTARAARRQDLGAIPLYTYFCVILFFMPVVNFAITAQGMYVITVFTVFWVMTRKAAYAVPL